MAAPPNYGAIPPPPATSKKPKRPPGPVSGTYAAGRLLRGAGSAYRGYWSLIEQQSKKYMGSTQWAVWALAALVAENPNAQNAQASITEILQDMKAELPKYGGSVDAWYKATHPGYTGAGPTSFLQQAAGKSLPPLPPALPGAQPPGLAQRQAKTALYNGWATLKNGKLTPSTDPTPPKNVVTFNGLPITVAQFNTYWKQLNSLYIAYTGKGATVQQAAHVLTSGIDTKYTLPKQLMSMPGFRNSPVWKSSVDAYKEAWNRVYGSQEKPDLGAIQRAMANRVAPTDFMYSLKDRSDYTRSEQYLSNSSVMQRMYESIYGKADQNGLQLIHTATLSGWDPDQFAAYLRKQPGYTSSSEYQAKLVSFLGALGMVTGGEPVLAGANRLAAPLTPGAPPPDRRVPYPGAGPQAVGPLSNLGATDTGGPPTPFLPAANPGV